MAITIYQSKCDGCGTCADGCPMKAIFIIDGKAEMDKGKCSVCGRCTNDCPTGAIRYQ